MLLHFVNNKYIALTEDEDYTVEYGENINKGVGTYTIKGINRFEGQEVNGTFNIGTSLTGAVIQTEFDSYEFTGEKIEPKVTVTFENNVLEQGKDYTVSYNSNTNIGKGRITVTGTGEYIGSVYGYFDIVSKPAEEHRHSPSEAKKENIRPSTCTVNGSYDEVVYCSVCGVEIIRETKTLELIAHTSVIDKAIAPTCTVTGLTQGSHCSVCGEILVAQQVVPALIPEGASVAVSGDKAVITLSDGSTITVPKDTKETVKNADGTYTVTLNNGSSVTVSSNTEIAKTTDGQFSVKATDNGQTTAVTVPSGSSVVKDGDKYKVIVVNGTATIEKDVVIGETVVIDKSGSMSCNGEHKWDNGKVTKAATYTATGVKTYTCTVCGATKTETIAKKAKKKNTLKVKKVKKTLTVKYSKLKKKTQSIKLAKYLKVTKAKGTVTYAKSSGNKKITVDKKTGKIKIKKGLKKGTYKVKIKVTAAGNTEYNAAVKTVTVKIKVK